MFLKNILRFKHIFFCFVNLYSENLNIKIHFRRITYIKGSLVVQVIKKSLLFLLFKKKKCLQFGDSCGSWYLGSDIIISLCVDTVYSVYQFNLIFEMISLCTPLQKQWKERWDNQLSPFWHFLWHFVSLSSKVMMCIFWLFSLGEKEKAQNLI